MENMRLAILLSALSGILLTGGFPRFSLPYLTWIALLPLFFALRGKTAKQALGLGFVCGLVHYLTTLYWIQYVIQHYGGIPLLLAIPVLLLLCGYLALYAACFSFLAHRWRNRPLLWIWGLPAAWVALEWIRGHALTGFPWAELGYTQTSFTVLTQVADITGVFGVSWLLVLANTCIMAAWQRYRWWRTSVVLFAALLAGACLYGSLRLHTVRTAEKHAAPWTVAAVQGDIDQAQKWDAAFQQTTMDRYLKLSLGAAHQHPAPALIVWPETAMPFFYGIDGALSKELIGMVRQIGTPVLFGSPAVGRIDGKPRLLNRAYLMNGQGRMLGHYDKQHLVPFGEYVPYPKVLFFVHKLVQAAGNFAAGDSSAPLKLDGHRVGVLICYEAIFPSLAKRTVDRGATALVNITNDAWFGNSSAPYQHLEMARWRAIEFRVPFVRSANTGVSAIFDATGRVLGSIPLGRQGYLVRTVHPLHMVTFYAVWGNVFAYFCGLLTAAGFLLSVLSDSWQDATN